MSSNTFEIKIDKKQVDDLEKQLRRIEKLLEKIFNLLDRLPILKRLLGTKDQNVEEDNG